MRGWGDLPIEKDGGRAAVLRALRKRRSNYTSCVASYRRLRARGAVVGPERERERQAREAVEAFDAALSALREIELASAEFPYVCPGCYAVGEERCASYCPDAAIERERDEDIARGEDDHGDEEDDDV